MNLPKEVYRMANDYAKSNAGDVYPIPDSHPV